MAFSYSAPYSEGSETSVYTLVVPAEDVDYITAEGVLEFNSNSDNSLMDFYTILGDSMVEPDETIIFGLSASPSGVGLIQGRDVAIATIVNDDSKILLLWRSIHHHFLVTLQIFQMRRGL